MRKEASELVNKRERTHRIMASRRLRNANATSEVGSESFEGWQQIIARQNQSLEAIAHALLGRNSEIHLPEFDPATEGADAHAWVVMADMVVGENSLQGSALLSALSRAMKGAASVWLSQISHTGLTWAEFKECFKTRFEIYESAAAFILNMNNKRPKEGESIAAYAATLAATLISRWSDMSIENIAVSIVLAHVAQFDNRLRRLAHTCDAYTCKSLQQELKAISIKRKMIDSAGDSAPKRQSSSSAAIKCFRCGSSGHKAFQL
ncbi:uncharacterized protein LOC119665836 [Teleopsis dalmanni]|uniref:uncharacterized protein LOC119664029 n=1 Tax=Teleopsis dalmanni TaxID=139649 RepID=UPI0018CF1648|nr:uncharacterized protein LOC119664029 [Teleopsis dalmanni]XP_037931014.1 uncharacterized protein LOC119665836 [Teleopsis dalmanni]